MSQDRDRTQPAQELLRSLMRELFQTEHSAQTHCRVEAERLGQSPAARALEAIARHADAVMEELPIRAKHHALPVSAGGLAVGEMFSQIRRHLADLLMDQETSYRATLLGVRHGLDVMKMFQEAAVAAGQDELAEWCDRIWQARAPLVESCAQQLSWFAQNPEQAVTQVRPRFVEKGLELLRSFRKKQPKQQDGTLAA